MYFFMRWIIWSFFHILLYIMEINLGILNKGKQRLSNILTEKMLSFVVSFLLVYTQRT